MLVSLCNISKKYHRIKGLFCTYLCLNTSCCSISKTFTCTIHACPKTIVIAIKLFPVFFYTWFFHSYFENKLIRRSSRISIYFIFIPFCFFSKSERFVLYYTNSIWRCKPCITIWCYSY